jgi:hypothetical protein
MADIHDLTKGHVAGSGMVVALCALVVLIPFQIYFNIYHNLSISVAQILSISLLVVSFLNYPKSELRELLRNKLVLLVVVLWGLMAVDALAAINKMTGIKYFLKWSSVIAVFFVVYLNLSKLEDLRSVLKVFLWTAAAVSIAAIVIYVTAKDNLEWVMHLFLNNTYIAAVMEPDTLMHKLVEDVTELNWYYSVPDGSLRLRAFGTFECVLLFSSYLGLIISFLAFYFTPIFSKAQKAANGIIYFFIIATLALTFTRSAYGVFAMVMFVNMALILLKLRKNKRIIGIMLSALILTGGAAVYAPTIRQGIMYRVAGTDGDIKVRLRYWKQGLGIMKARPLMGVGLANYGEGLKKYVNPPEKPWRAAHSQYIQIGAEMGAVGVLVYLLIIFYGLYYSWITYLKSQDYKVFTLGLGFIGMWIWIAFQNMFFDSIFSPKFGMMFWAMVALNARLYDLQRVPHLQSPIAEGKSPEK